MSSLGVSATTSNFSADLESYIFHSTVQLFETISDKIVLSLYSVVLLISLVQTFWKNQRIDRLFAYMNEAYSGGRFASNQIFFHEQIITCYRFDQRYSHIPNPNRSIVLIIVTHVQVLMIIMIRTLFDRRNELVNDCLSFRDPYRVLQCDNNQDPCRMNDTDSAPKCTYYYFEMTHFITMVTSVITWHYALRYFVIKLVRFIRWLSFRDDDQPRRVCCCCQPTPRCLRLIMCLQYSILWLYIFAIVLFGFVWNRMLFRVPVDALGSVWAPIIIAGDRLCSLVMIIAPELLENWLNTTAKSGILQQKELSLAKIEPLIHVIDMKEDLPTSPKDNVQVPYPVYYY